MIFAVFISFFLCCISLFLIFDEIIRTEYKYHFSEWKNSGKPHGFFFRPEETKVVGGLVTRFGSWLAMQRLLFSLIWKTPEWALNESRILKLIVLYRILNFLALIVWLGFAYLTMFTHK